MLSCLGFLSDHFVAEFVLLFFIEEMSSLSLCLTNLFT